ncbi:MAG: signal peptidase I [Armatimonadetes bacterium]|nr:signal peptidase I [Armatimonadota bacterium]
MRDGSNGLTRSLGNAGKANKVIIGVILVVFLIILPVGSFIWFRMSVRSFYTAGVAMRPTLMENDRFTADLRAYIYAKPAFRDVIIFLAPDEATRRPGKGVVWVKRVIGLPGDTIRVCRGYVLVDGVEYGRREIAGVIASDALRADGVKFLKDRIIVGGKSISKVDLAAKMDAKAADIRIVPGLVYRNGKPLDEPYTLEDCDLDYPMDTTPKSLIVTVDGKKCVKIPDGNYMVMGDNRNNSNDGRFWGSLDGCRIKGKAKSIFYPFNRSGPIR